MEILIDGEWIEINSDEYNDYKIGKATNTGYDD